MNVEMGFLKISDLTFLKYAYRNGCPRNEQVIITNGTSPFEHRNPH